MPNSITRLTAKVATDGIKSAHKDYLEERLFEAVVTAGAVVAVADGVAKPGERAELIDFVDRSTWLQSHTSDETAQAYDARVRQFTLEGGIPEAISSLRGVGDGLGGRVVMAAGHCVACADGSVPAAEQDVLQAIRSALDPA